MSITTFSVRARLSLSFGILAALVLGVAGLASYDLNAANQRFYDYANGLAARATVAAHIEAAVDRRAIAARNLVLISQSEDPAAERGKVMAAHEDAVENVKRLQEMLAKVTNTTNTTVGSVVVNTQATDAAGMAAAARQALVNEYRGASAQFDDGVAR